MPTLSTEKPEVMSKTVFRFVLHRHPETVLLSTLTLTLLLLLYPGSSQAQMTNLNGFETISRKIGPQQKQIFRIRLESGQGLIVGSIS